MTLLTTLNTLGLGSPTAPLRCRRGLWRNLLHDLHRRGGNAKESGAFLLGETVNKIRRIEHYLLFDAIDPNALTGGIDFDGSKMDQVWDECRRRNLQVVADVHTHPRGYGQSSIDRDNPMMPRRGHIAIIVPDFARKPVGPGKIGMYELVGPSAWTDHSRAGSTFFSLEWF